MSDESDEQDAIVQEFLIESYENLDSLDREFVDLERDPQNIDVLSSIFRTIHTIKGTSGFLAFGTLETVTHRGENLLSQLRDGSKVINPDITNGLLAMVDAVRDILSSIEDTAGEGDEDYKELIVDLERLSLVETPEADPVVAPPPETDLSSQETIAEPPPTSVDEALVDPSEISDVAESDSDAEAESPLAVEAPLETAKDESSDAERPIKAKGPSLADSSIRVDVGLLDKLMNLVGELVLARNQVVQFSAAQTDAAFVATCQQLNLITTELQEGVMKTRMQPIENVWSKFPRVVRDLANGCNKQVRVEMEGKETELDKTIIESIKDPLTHIVRNSVDHGIESPEERIAAGKPAEGRLLLRAFHEGGLVNIEIADDGGGIDPAKLKAKALEKNVITADRAAKMTDREIVNLVFEAGFSTADKVTNVSGRGVGMDVVRSNIEKIGGNVDIQSKLGHGTTLKIKIPLTLAIIPALVVGNSGDRFAIPQVSLLELVRLEGEQAARGIEMIHGAPVYRLRGKLLPIVYLRDELGGQPDSAQVTEEQANDEHMHEDVINIVVLQADDHQFGLVVDSVNDTEEIVVKPLGDQLKGLSAFAGATIMGDGSVALILDVMGLAQNARIVSESANEDVSVGNRTGTAIDSDGVRPLLILGLGRERRMAIDLSLVARLEEFQRTAIERTGHRQAVQYRERIMPLVLLPEMFGFAGEPASGEARDTIHVVVYKAGDQSIGLVVEEIVDIVEERIEIEHCADMVGVFGTAIVQGEVTDLIDVEGIVRSEIGIGNELAAEV
ncbi:MAG: two-component system chemotaxis sensor kinase CheA [Myxococcota bacterium]|jgi:two-component system chemotaxis sensor kinase CheA